jgi:hypothetical protein
MAAFQVSYFNSEQAETGPSGSYNECPLLGLASQSRLSQIHPLRKFGSEFSVQGEDPICHHVRRKVRYGVMVNPASHTKFLTDTRVKAFARPTTSS